MTLATSSSKLDTWTNKLKGFPDITRFTTCDGLKRPVSPITKLVEGNTGWTTRGYTPEQLDEFHLSYEATGVMLGEISGGLCAFDFDGITNEEFRDIFGCNTSDLPPTVSFTSGKLGRYQSLFYIPRKHWKDISPKQLQKDKEVIFECRWNGQMSVVSGAHPEGRTYSFLPGRSPTEIGIATMREEIIENLKVWLDTYQEDQKVQEDKAQDKTYLDILYDISKYREILRNWLPYSDDFGVYDNWRNVGMIGRLLSLKVNKPDLLFKDFDYWSSKQPKYETTKKTKAKWDSFKREEGEVIGLGSLIRNYAEPNGYTPSQTFEEFKKDQQTEPEKEEEAVKRIKKTIDELYKLEKEGGDWNRRQYLKSILGGYQIRKDEVQLRLLEMIALEHDINLAEKKTDKRRHRTFSSKMSKEEAMEPLLPGFLIEGKDCLLMGESGAGKTLAVLGLSYFVATGSPILDNPFGVVTEKQGATLGIFSDGGEGSFGMVKKYADMLNPPEKDLWEDNFNFWGADVGNDVSSWGFTIKGISELIEELKQGHPNGAPYKLVIVDSLKKVVSLGGIDFGIGPMDTVMQLAQGIASKFNVCWVWVHHTKPNSKGGLNGIASSGGNSNIYQIPYACHRLLATSSPEHKHITKWIVDKFRGEKRREFQYVLSESMFDLIDAEEATDLTTKILKAIWTGTKEPDGCQGRYASANQIADTTAIKVKTVRNNMTNIKKSGLVRYANSLYYLSKQGAKQLSIDDVGIRAEVEDFIKEQWGRV